MRINTVKSAAAAIALITTLACGSLAIGALEGHSAAAVRHSVSADAAPAPAPSAAATTDSNDPWD